jgi:hypothetical protein
MFADGQVVDFDESEASLKLVPVDVNAYSMLVRKYGADRVAKLHGPGPSHVPEAPPVDSDQLSLRQMSEQ